MFLVCSENFFEMTGLPPPPSVANMSGKKNLDAFFIRKVPLLAPLVEASYAPG